MANSKTALQKETLNLFEQQRFEAARGSQNAGLDVQLLQPSSSELRPGLGLHAGVCLGYTTLREGAGFHLGCLHAWVPLTVEC